MTTFDPTTRASEVSLAPNSRMNLAKLSKNLLLGGVTCAAIVSLPPLVIGQKCVVGKISEIDMRKHARKQVLPEFPKQAKDLNVKGVAVVEVQLNARSEISSILIIQSPHPSVNRALTEAVSKWLFEFNQDREETPLCFKGKLTFYFIDENGTSLVRHPKRFGKG